MTSNLLCFNSAKTEFLLLGLKPQLNIIHNPALTLINGASVCPSPSARNLGFIFDAHLTFSDQISSLARASTTSGISDAYALSLTSVQPTSLAMAHHSYIQSSITATHCTMYMVFQKPSWLISSISRIILLVPLLQLPGLLILTRFSNLSTGLRYRSASNTQIISTTYKVLQSSSPHYLCDIITIQPSRSTRSSSLVTLLHPQAQSSLKITNRSFRYAAPHLWNKLHPSLRVPCQLATCSQSALLHCQARLCS